MLKFLRSKKTAKKIWITLAIVIIPAFCLWGVGSALRGRKGSAFLGKVSGKPVSIQEYIKNYKAVRNQYLIRLGENEFTKLEKYLNLEAQVWDRIVLLAEAKRRRIRINNKDVVDFIKQYPFFKSNDTFDPQLYQELLTYAFRTTPRAFEEEIRDNLIIAKLYSEVTDEITVSDNEIRDTYKEINEQISLDYISVTTADFLDGVSVEEQELKDYYNENSEQFKKPLSYNLEYIKLASKDRQTINKIAQSINQGFSLMDTAKDSGLEVKQTGLFSINEPIPHIGWSTEILGIIPKLNPRAKTWAKPIKVDDETVYFIALKEKKEPYIPPFEDVKPQVQQNLRQQKASQIAKENLKSCRKEAETIGLTEAAGKFNLHTDKTELFKRRTYVKGLGDSDIFFEAVENLKEDQISEIINTPTGFCVVKLRERIEPEEDKFEEEKKEFADNLLEQRKQDYFNKLLNELKNKPNTFLKSIE
jgi:peptidyl-prolyl cis-trans isomerase D